MATRYLTRALFSTIKPMTSVISHSYTTSAVLPNSSFIIRLRPLVAAVSASYFRRLSPAVSARSFSTRQTSSSLNDPNPNWSNRPPKETILLDGCDFEHWLVVVEPPEADLTRDDIIDSYIKTLATVIGSEEEARMKIYSVSTRHYFAFGALVSEELSYKIKELPNVRWVLPDSYMDVKNKDYGGEPFINGQALPYDPRYHEEWVRNNSRANERNRRNDRPRNFDRSRNFERRREMTGGGNVGGGPGGGGNMGPPPPTAPNNGGMQPNYGGGMPQNNNSTGNYPSRGPAANNNGPNYYGPNSGQAPYQPSPGPVAPGQGQNQNNAYAPNGGGGNPYQGQNAPAQAPNRGYVQGQNVGGYAPNPGHAPGPSPNNYSQNPNNYGQNPNNYGQSQNGYGSNVGPGQGQNQGGYGNPSQNQNVPGRDPNY